MKWYDDGRVVATIALCTCVLLGMVATKDATISMVLILGLLIIW